MYDRKIFVLNILINNFIANEVICRSLKNIYLLYNAFLCAHKNLNALSPTNLNQFFIFVNKSNIFLQNIHWYNNKNMFFLLLSMIYKQKKVSKIRNRYSAVTSVRIIYPVILLFIV